MSTNRQTWLIRPHDPLIFRDGRPFGPTPGARAHSLSFPFPSTTAGGARTQARTNEEGIFDLKTSDKDEEKKLLAELKQLQVYGPLLAEITDHRQQPLASPSLLVPAPLDALVLQKKGDEPYEVNVNQLVPLEQVEGSMTDLDDKLQAQEAIASFYLVGLTPSVQNKPFSGAPRYWYWERFLSWLEDPQAIKDEILDARQLGHSGPDRERRVHLSMDSEKRSGLDGALFDTHGMEFLQRRSVLVHRESGKIVDAKEVRSQDIEQQGYEWNSYIAHLALAVAVEIKSAADQIHEGLNSFGGERRMVSWRSSHESFPVCPESLRQRIIETGCCRLILLTPGYFSNLFQPEAFGERAQCQIQLQGIATQRPQVVSGYDIALKRPKKTTRLAPAGTVFYLNLQGNDHKTIESWIERTWMHNISDERDARNESDNGQKLFDGFGLAVLGTWSGQPAQLEIEEKNV